MKVKIVRIFQVTKRVVILYPALSGSHSLFFLRLYLQYKAQLLTCACSDVVVKNTSVDWNIAQGPI
jgi:hypothetical protein